MTSTTDATALADLVAAEQAAVFGLSAVGGHLDDLAPGSGAAAAVRSAYDVHRLRRDSWTAAIRARDGQVPVAAAAYALPAFGDLAATTAAAAGLEQRCAAAYDAALVALTDRGLRTEVVAALGDAARRSYALLTGAGVPVAVASVAFPGRQDG